MATAPTPLFDAVVIGGGPAGLSAALQLVRAKRQVAILDANRPRHAATLHSHGYLSRDGASPLELRKLGREEFSAYPGAKFAPAIAQRVTGLAPAEAHEMGCPDGIAFAIAGSGIRGAAGVNFIARRVLVASGLREILPPLPTIRAFYGTALHSCIECDGYEKSGQQLALIGESADLFMRAVQISRFSSDLIVFTNAAPVISPAAERQLLALGVLVERRAIADVVGDHTGLTGVALCDGEVIARSAGFVRPRWEAQLEFMGDLPVQLDDAGLLAVDSRGESSVRGVYAAGDTVPPGPQQVVIAAGDGARVGAQINLDLLREMLGEGSPDA